MDQRSAPPPVRLRARRCGARPVRAARGGGGAAPAAAGESVAHPAAAARDCYGIDALQPCLSTVLPRAARLARAACLAPPPPPRRQPVPTRRRRPAAPRFEKAARGPAAVAVVESGERKARGRGGARRRGRCRAGKVAADLWDEVGTVDLAAGGVPAQVAKGSSPSMRRVDV